MEVNVSIRDVGGLDFIREQPWVAWPYLIIGSFISVFGTAGNLAALGAVLLNKNLRHIRNAFLINLAAADLIVTSFADPMSVVGMILGKRFFDERPWICDVVATLCLAACVTALFSIGGISFNRCLNICHPDLYSRVFKPKVNIGLCVAFWVAGILMSFPPLFGWSRNVYDHKYMECVFNRLHSESYTIFYTAVVVFTPVMIISVSYLKIYLHVRASKKRIAQIKGPDDKNGLGRASGSLDSSLKLARTLFCIFGVFVFCWAPFAILVVVDREDKAPMELHLYILLLAHMHSTLNPVVYALTNKHYRQGYRLVFTYVLSCGNKRKLAMVTEDASSVSVTNTASTVASKT